MRGFCVINTDAEIRLLRVVEDVYGLSDEEKRKLTYGKNI